FSYSNGKITWDEIRYDKRFQKQDYNVINVYDLNNKKYKQLSHKTRLFSPTLSADTKQIAAIEVALNNEENLVILSSETGEETLRIKVPNSIHFQTHSFPQSGKKIIAVGISEAGTNLIEFDLSTQPDSILLTDLTQQFERSIYAEASIIFKAFYNGIDNLYS